MAKFKSLDVYPYSGWYEKPWDNVRTGDEALDIDAAARSARRVTESLSAALALHGFQAGSSSWRIMTHTGITPNLEIEDAVIRNRDWFLGGLFVPSGFRFLDPRTRRELLGEAITTALRRLAVHSEWDASAFEGAVTTVRDSDFECAWTSAWKFTRDRKLRVRLAGHIEDDGYGRWRIITASAASEEPVAQSAEILGWTWLENFRRAARDMRFVAPRTLAIGSGSMSSDRIVHVDIETGADDRPEPDEVPTSYPGESGRVLRSPQVIVIPPWSPSPR